MFHDRWHYRKRQVPVAQRRTPACGVLADFADVFPQHHAGRAIAPAGDGSDHNLAESGTTNGSNRAHLRRRDSGAAPATSAHAGSCRRLGTGQFWILAVVLATAGIYGSIAYSVARRTREIGIRVALGATRQNVLKLVLSRASIVLAVGICVGLAAALATGNLFRAVLYGISPTDPATYITAVAAMTAVALLAVLAPAQRAIRIDPAQALREE